MLQHFGKWLGSLLELNTMTQQLYSREMSAYIHQKKIFKNVSSSLICSRLETTQKAFNIIMDS